MSYINFESATLKEIERKERKQAREAILSKAEAEYKHRKEKEETAKLRGDDKWMLPSVEARIKAETKKDKKKKHKKKKKKAKKTKSSNSDSDEDSKEEDEWVEKVVEAPQNLGTVVIQEPKDKTNEGEVTGNSFQEDNGSKNEVVQNKKERDEWMTMPGLFPCVSREQLRNESGRLSKAEQQRQKDKYMIDTLGQSDRELNPYWKDGGSGLPQEKEEYEMEKSRTQQVKAVGDQGVNWLHRALKRAKEQAAEQGRSLEEVAAERWGSLAKLEAMIAEAEGKSKLPDRRESTKKDYDRREKEERRREWRKERQDGGQSSRTIDVSKKNKSSSHRYKDRNEDGRDNISSRSFQKPKTEDDRLPTRIEENDSGISYHSRSHTNSRTHFQKPKDDSEISNKAITLEEKGSGYPVHYRSTASSGNWRKKMPENAKSSDDKKNNIESKPYKKPSSVSSSSSSSESEEEKKDTEGPLPVLTDKEMNDLGAKLVKAEILGNEELAKALKQKLDAARSARATKSVDVKSSAAPDEDETVILTRTDSRGFVRPLQQTAHVEPIGGRRKKQKTDTHTDGKRVRYFADDDKYSLKDLFEREKLSTVQDQNEMFSKLAAKVKEESDMDDLFVEQAQKKESDGKIQSRERDKAIREHKKVDKALENCSWCFDSKQMLKHLIVAIGNKVCLSLPPYQSLTEGHCLIVPMYHTPCATQLDEDVWTEMQTFRKTLVSMFQTKLNLDVVFFETAMYLRKFPHMLLECVPMPRETGDMAPIYFKKAILECEMEWSINKKLVDLSGKDVRRAIPKGLPYFSVDFGLDSGFAHVIENEKMFPKNFAQEIIGGMLDLDHSLWRKPRRENFDVQRRKVVQFSEWWKPFDFTIGKRKHSSSSDSD